MAESLQPEKPVLIFDGKRMRAVWLPGDGDGDSTRSVIDRSINSVRGHPTWKLYMRNIKTPILRSSAHEPPRYVYLDDQACYTVWCSDVYTKDELRQFWPFDFDYLGNIKTGRKNRGRPAYLNEARTLVAQGRLREKNSYYEFLGQPEEFNTHVPGQPMTQTNTEIKITEETARESGEKSGKLEITDGGRTSLATQFTTNIEGATSNSYIEKKATNKRKDARPVTINSSDTDPASTLPKRSKLDRSKCQSLGAHSIAGLDSMHEHGENATNMAFAHLRNENSKLKYDLKNERDAVVQLKQENRALVMRSHGLLDEMGRLREICLQLLIEKRGQQNDLDHRVIAFQRFSNEIDDLSNQLKKVAISAAKDIAPTERLVEDIGCVLSRTEKHMYELGQEELWRELRAEAEKLCRTQSSAPSSSQQRPWSFC